MKISKYLMIYTCLQRVAYWIQLDLGQDIISIILFFILEWRPKQHRFCYFFFMCHSNQFVIAFLRLGFSPPKSIYYFCE